jgi:hypothetical protein
VADPEVDEILNRAKMEIPEFNTLPWRAHYQDDPAVNTLLSYVLAATDALRSREQDLHDLAHTARTRRTLYQGYKDEVEALEKDLAEALDKIARARKREAEWRRLIEEVAKATGVWGVGMEVDLHKLEEPGGADRP